jgi:hypothetical protein
LFSRWSDDLGRQVSDGDIVRQQQKKNGTLTYGEVTFAPFVVSVRTSEERKKNRVQS